MSLEYLEVYSNQGGSADANFHKLLTHRRCRYGTIVVERKTGVPAGANPKEI